MNFDLNVFLTQAAQIPQENILVALRAVTGRKTELDQLPEIWAQRNSDAQAYHDRAPAETVEGVKVWQAPFSDFSAYPSQMQVHHVGAVWWNPGPDVVMGEPGVDGQWQEVAAEPVEGEEGVVENE